MRSPEAAAATTPMTIATSANTPKAFALPGPREPAEPSPPDRAYGARRSRTDAGGVTSIATVGVPVSMT